MRIDEQLEIQAPLEECYKLGIAFPKYPEFLSGVKKIQALGAQNVWHWEVETSQGRLLKWDVEVVGEKHHNQVISWRTVRYADIAHSGAITFRPVDAHTTAMHLVVEFEPVSPGLLQDLEQDGTHAIQNFINAFKFFAEGAQVR